VAKDAEYPPDFSTNALTPKETWDLKAEALAGKLRVVCAGQAPAHLTRVLYASADELGHWPARDWRAFPMSNRGGLWDAFVPVEDLDVPVVYFVSEAATPVPTSRNASSGRDSLPPTQRGPAPGGLSRDARLSPMRRVQPRAVGLQEPSQPFGPFLAGFETGLEGWRLLGDASEGPPLQADPAARTGGRALCVTVPAGKRSGTLATTRLRGWQLQRQNAWGVRLWLRTRAGTALARFSLLAHSGTPQQVVAVRRTEQPLKDAWQRVDLRFAEFAELPLYAVDQLTIEFIGQGPIECLVDDVELLGNWPSARE
jgi:hypothetical protein